MRIVKLKVCTIFQRYALCNHMYLNDSSPPPRLNVSDYVQSDAHRQLSLDAAMATMVLMKNNETMKMTLPLVKPVNTACVSLLISD